LEHNPKEAKERDISTEKAKEYTEENKGKEAYSKLRERLIKKK
jgi:hypothetical protein